MSSDPRIAALLRERAGLVQQGKDERVKQIDAELKTRGYEPPAKEAPAEVVETKKVEERKQPPQGRRAPGPSES